MVCRVLQVTDFKIDKLPQMQFEKASASPQLIFVVVIAIERLNQLVFVRPPRAASIYW